MAPVSPYRDLVERLFNETVILDDAPPYRLLIGHVVGQIDRLDRSQLKSEVTGELWLQVLPAKQVTNGDIEILIGACGFRCHPYSGFGQVPHPRHGRIDQVAEHRVIGLDRFTLAFGMIEEGVVEDMRDVAQPRERRNRFLSIRQIDSNSRDIIAI